MNAVALRLNKTLIRREFWENRSLWMVPAVVICLMTLTGLIKVAMYLTGHLSAGQGIHIVSIDEGDMPNFDAGKAAVIARLMTMACGAPFDIIMVIVVFFYMLDSLYSDRRDRSVLFWRSMPVSDARIVLAKLATGMMAAIGITLAATVIGGLIAGLFELISEIFVPHSIILLSHPLAMLEGWGTVAYALTAQTIWFLPFFGWWMLASAWAKKAPFLWATLPPVLVVLAELILFRTHHFWDMMRMHVVNWMTILNIGPVMEGESGKDFMLQGDYLSMTGLGRYLASPELWIGTALGAAFIYAAIWLRRNRSEI